MKRRKSRKFWLSGSYESYLCVLLDGFCFEVQTCKYYIYHKMRPKSLDSGDYMKDCNMCCRHFLSKKSPYVKFLKVVSSTYTYYIRL